MGLDLDSSLFFSGGPGAKHKVIEPLYCRRRRKARRVVISVYRDDVAELLACVRPDCRHLRFPIITIKKPRLVAPCACTYVVRSAGRLRWGGAGERRSEAEEEEEGVYLGCWDTSVLQMAGIERAARIATGIGSLITGCVGATCHNLAEGHINRGPT